MKVDKRQGIGSGRVMLGAVLEDGCIVDGPRNKNRPGRAAG